MNYLIKGQEKKEKIAMLISFTSIKSKGMHNAIIDYYCGENNRNKRAAALMNDVKEPNLCRDIKKINKVAGQLERYKEMEWPEYQALKENNAA